MKLDMNRVKSLCKQQNISISELLEDAGVSRNAFYALTRKRSVVPRSIRAVAQQLGVPVSKLLDKGETPAMHLMGIANEARRIAARHPDADPDNIRHALILLDETPADRLRRALQRGRQLDLR